LEELSVVAVVLIFQTLIWLAQELKTPDHWISMGKSNSFTVFLIFPYFEVLKSGMKRKSFILLAILATVVGLYPSIYFLIDRRFGLLQSKSAALLADPLWNIQFYIHIILGGIALLIGWIQFLKPQGVVSKFHRKAGKIYVISALLSSLSSIYIAFFATGGVPAALGFLCLGGAVVLLHPARLLEDKRNELYQTRRTDDLQLRLLLCRGDLKGLAPAVNLLFW
jgi:uncharacterized membrane protein